MRAELNMFYVEMAVGREEDIRFAALRLHFEYIIITIYH